MITLAGLGTTKDGLSLKAFKAISGAKKVMCRTQFTESAAVFKENDIDVEFLDDVFENSRNFDSLNKKLAARVMEAAKTQDVVYCVDGSVADDNSCAIILKKCKNVEIIEAASHSAKALGGLDFRGGYTSLSAYRKDKFNSSVMLPLAVYDLDDKLTASEWKLLLTDAFGDEAPAAIYINGKIHKIALYEADSFENYGYDTVLVVFDRKFTEKERFNINDLFDIITALRAENGCPWDREQTRESIKNNLIEESYEMYDAINNGDIDGILEESGDMFLQLVFHTLFAEEEHSYNRGDVFTGICSKMIFRHSHVFGSDNAGNGEQALDVWEKNKTKEKGYKNGREYIDCVPHSFPALMRAQKMQKRAAKYNFDFSSIEQIYQKIAEETEEVRQAKRELDECNTADKNVTLEALKAEIGDLLFSVVNLARFYKIDAEEALKTTCDKFLKRFSALEEAIEKDGKGLKNMTEEEIDKYYNEIKKS